VTVAGREVRLIERGAGPAVFLLHGLGLTGTVWEPHLGVLATAFQEPPSLVAGVARRYLTGPPASAGTWVRSQRQDSALDAPLVACPTLIVIGGQDRWCPGPSRPTWSG